MRNKFIPTPEPSENVNMVVDRNHWSNKDLDSWKTKQFKEYFYHKYFTKVGLPHPINVKKHTGQMARLIKAYGETTLKAMIDAFFDIGYTTLSLEYFSTTARQAEIQQFLADGTLPFFIAQKPNYDTAKAGPTWATPTTTGRIDCSKPNESAKPQSARSFEDFFGGA